jgi:hypothetical protein
MHWLYILCSVALKGVWHEIFDISFFHVSVSPRPLIIPLESFRLFSKIRGDNREWMLISMFFIHCAENPILCFQKWHRAALLPIPTFMYLGIYKSLTDTRMWNLGDRTLYSVLEITRLRSFLSGRDKSEQDIYVGFSTSLHLQCTGNYLFLCTNTCR